MTAVWTELVTRQDGFVLSRNAVWILSWLVPVSNLQLFSLKYIEDYWKLSWLVANLVHTANTDMTGQFCLVLSVSVVWTRHNTVLQCTQELDEIPRKNFSYREFLFSEIHIATIRVPNIFWIKLMCTVYSFSKWFCCMSGMNRPVSDIWPKWVNDAMHFLACCKYRELTYYVYILSLFFLLVVIFTFLIYFFRLVSWDRWIS